MQGIEPKDQSATGTCAEGVQLSPARRRQAAARVADRSGHVEHKAPASITAIVVDGILQRATDADQQRRPGFRQCGDGRRKGLKPGREHRRSTPWALGPSKVAFGVWPPVERRADKVLAGLANDAADDDQLARRRHTRASRVLGAMCIERVSRACCRALSARARGSAAARRSATAAATAAAATR